jgi:hypothetical protein
VDEANSRTLGKKEEATSGESRRAMVRRGGRGRDAPCLAPRDPYVKSAFGADVALLVSRPSLRPELEAIPLVIPCGTSGYMAGR